MSLSQSGAAITLLAAAALLIPASLGLFLTGAPTVFCPFPMLTAIPALMLAQWHLEDAAVLLPLTLFLLWNPQLFRGEGKIPKRSYILFAVLVGLNAVDFVLSWKWGLQYEGPPYTAIVCSINIAWIGFLGLALRRWLNTSPSFRASLFFHWMLFAWLCWYAFPWLGEVP